MVFKWHSPEILENYGLSKHDKFPRRATGQLGYGAHENDMTWGHKYQEADIYLLQELMTLS